MLWRTLPPDLCPRCFDPPRGGTPLAVSAARAPFFQVRYQCPGCNHTWDTSYAAQHPEWADFRDRFVGLARL